MSMLNPEPISSAVDNDNLLNSSKNDLISSSPDDNVNQPVATNDVVPLPSTLASLPNPAHDSTAATGIVSLQAFLNSLPNHHHPYNSNSSQCSICLSEENPATNPLNELPCGHCFHGDCLLKWIMKGNTCPFCRSKLGVDPDCPDLTKTRWARTGRDEWMSVDDGVGRWTLRWSATRVYDQEIEESDDDLGFII